jgi:hypothetical protein
VKERERDRKDERLTGKENGINRFGTGELAFPTKIYTLKIIDL